MSGFECFVIVGSYLPDRHSYIHFEVYVIKGVLNSVLALTGTTSRYVSANWFMGPQPKMTSPTFGWLEV